MVARRLYADRTPIVHRLRADRAPRKGREGKGKEEEGNRKRKGRERRRLGKKFIFTQSDLIGPLECL